MKTANRLRRDGRKLALTPAGELLSLRGRALLASADDVVSAVNAHKPGDTITLTIFSGGQQKDVSVKLGDRPEHVQDSNSSTLP